ncbi:MAG: ROK family transcriptional regulator [Paracoccaceae bacterium]
MIIQQREQGRRTLLSAIRRIGSVARIDLASETDISRATVTTITAELLRDGLIEEIPRDTADGDARRGRPRVDLKIRGAAHLIAGAKIGDSTLSLVLLDFEGVQLAELETDLAHQVWEADTLADCLLHNLQQLASKADITYDQISGVGVGIAGIVDAPSGVVYWSPSLKERNIEFCDILKKRLNIPAFLDNDANLVAVAEQSFGEGRDVSDFIVVTIESGVGMGIVIGGKLYRGTRGCGAEFGHTKVQLDGALCRCGQRGCLEAYVADYALLREASVIATDDRTTRTEERIKQLLDAARDGDETASNIINRAGRMFAMGLANLVNIFDPQLIILAGERMQADHLYAEGVLESIRSSIVQIDKSPPEIVIHKWGSLMWAKGAAAYALAGVAEIALLDMNEHAE